MKTIRILVPKHIGPINHKRVVWILALLVVLQKCFGLLFDKKENLITVAYIAIPLFIIAALLSTYSRSRHKHLLFVLLLCIRNFIPVLISVVALALSKYISRRFFILLAGLIPLIVVVVLFSSKLTGGYGYPAPFFVFVTYWGIEAFVWSVTVQYILGVADSYESKENGNWNVSPVSNDA